MFPKNILFSLVVAASASSPDQQDKPLPVCKDDTFKLSKAISGVTILSVTAKSQENHTTEPAFGYPAFQVQDFCQIKISYKHVGSHEKINTEVWLPSKPDEWNGRYQATGGGGFSTGMFDAALAPAINGGYAASSTDGGHQEKASDDLSWALKTDGSINMDLMQISFTRSLADQIPLSKLAIEQFYGEKPRYSYWVGCSQGGRQGYMIAQSYPDLLDGVLANAPAISLTHLSLGDFWPQLVMKEVGHWMSKCEFDFFHQKTMEACDMTDGVSDGVISDPEACDFDPLHIIGNKFFCDGRESEVTPAMAEVVRKIEQGPQTVLKRKIWHGYPPGTSMQAIAGTTTSLEGIRQSAPFKITANYFTHLLLQDPSFNVTKLTYTEYMALWVQASYRYSSIMDADSPNLERFRARGGKLLTWHGLVDPVIPYQNTVAYREQVETLMGGAEQVDKFYRLFLAPGAAHCLGGIGPVPVDPLAALVDWVEKGEAPEVLDARTIDSKGDLVSRDLCAWPAKSKYMGLGDAKRASSWSCVGGTERQEVNFESADEGSQVPLGQRKSSGRSGSILNGLKDRLEGLNMGLRIG